MAQITIVNALQYIVDEAMRVLDGIDCHNTKVVWFGHTVYIDIIQKSLISRGKRIHYVIDNDVNKWGMILEDDLIVFPVEQIVGNYKENAVFLISSRYEPEMRQQLLESGVCASKIAMLPSREESDAAAREFLLKQTQGLKKIELREMQLTMLDIIKVFRDFCDSSGLRYFLAGGTLLGAVRHKGFIPWDDDADVYLPYEDYQRFIDVFPVGGRYEVVNWEKNPGFPLDFAKLVDNHTVMWHGGYPVQWLHGVSICVIPISGYPDDKDKIQQKRHTNDVLDLKWYWYQNAREVIFSELQDLRRDIYELKNNMPFDGSPITAKTHLLFKPFWYVPHWVFAESVLVEFEGEYFSAPVGYDYYLKHRFENYMKLPPEHERKKHETISFWKERRA